MPTLDVDLARALTPGCEQVLHLNHAGTSLAPQPVLDAVIGHLEREARIGGYEAGDAAAPELTRAYEALGRLVGAPPTDIAFTGSGTEAWTEVARAFALTSQDRVVLTRQEYGSNAMALLQLRERTGCELVLVEDDPSGQVDVAAVERVLQEGRVAFVSLVHVPSGSGLINPAAEVGRACQAAGVPLVLDACQSAGQLPLDVDALGCDALVACGRKFLRGPRGTGFLYVRPSLLPRLQPLTIDLPSSTWVAPDRYEPLPTVRRFERWEASVALRLGLGAAAEHALGWGLDAIAERTAALAASLRDRMGDVPGVVVHDRGPRLGAITTFTMAGRAPLEVRDALRAHGTNVSVTVLAQAQLDLPHRGLDDLLRASVHYTTTDDELERFTRQVAAIAAGG